jgi:hypothetical protein
LGGPVAGDRHTDGHEEILLAHSWPASTGSSAGSEAQQPSGGGRGRACAV